MTTRPYFTHKPSLMNRIFIPFLLPVLLLFGCQSGKPGQSASGNEIYYPPPDSSGGWRILSDPAEIRRMTGIDKARLDSAFDFIRTTTKNGGLLVMRHGYLVYENYFGKGRREAHPNLGSCGKSFTGVAAGIMLGEYPGSFPDGLDQKVFTPEYLPEKFFPLADPRMADITLGQLLSFSSGIRGLNPGYIDGKPVNIGEPGPDGWYAMVDDYALGLKEGEINGVPFTTRTLWTNPGGGYSYSTASTQIVSIIIRRITGMELEDYVAQHLARPLGWQSWSYGYHYQPQVSHTPGGGGICLRSTDMLRFCYTLLHGGRWDGRQIIPADFVQKAEKASPYNPHFPFSMQFNVNTTGYYDGVPRDAFWKPGSGGHCFYVIPSLDLIVWKMGGRDGQYSRNDTGLPEPDPLPDAIPPLPEKKEFHGDVYHETIRLVLLSTHRREACSSSPLIHKGTGERSVSS